jgi:hypothetical protein
MVRIQNIRASDHDVLARARNWDLVRIVLACGDRVCLARWVYADYLDHEVTVLVLVVGAICEVTVNLIQVQSQMNVAVSFLYNSVYSSGSSRARFDDLKSVRAIDVATDGRGIAAS